MLGVIFKDGRVTLLLYCICVKQVSAYPRQVTQSIFKAIAKGQAASSVLSAANGTRLVLVDVGVDGDVTCVNGDGIDIIDVRHSKVRGWRQPTIRYS